MKNILTVILIALAFSCNSTAQKNNENKNQTYKMNKTEQEWREILTPQQYQVLREKGTERPFTGEYNLHFEQGSYTCAGCGTKLFESTDKFRSDCGWPSFDNAIEGSITYKEDRTHGMVRTEILCSNCGGHLGHVFNDGPTQTGLRYCVNSLSLDFDSAETQKDSTENTPPKN